MDNLAIDSHIGERIRYYRQKAGLTQKALAESCGLSEAAIRNYELGNRIPDYETIMDIAENLQVSIYTLMDPKLDHFFGVLHALFRLEETYGLHPEVSRGKVRLTFEYSEATQATEHLGGTLAQIVRLWNRMYHQYQNGTISKEEYQNWKNKYPEFAEPQPAPSDLNLPPIKRLNSTAKVKRKRKEK